MVATVMYHGVPTNWMVIHSGKPPVHGSHKIMAGDLPPKATGESTIKLQNSDSSLREMNKNMFHLKKIWWKKESSPKKLIRI